LTGGKAFVLDVPVPTRSATNVEGGVVWGGGPGMRGGGRTLSYRGEEIEVPDLLLNLALDCRGILN